VIIMFFLRLIILLLLVLFFRRLYLAVRKVMGADGSGRVNGPRRPDRPKGRTGRKPSDGKFREEDISDADFEEIP
jgi:hypothetical protein